MGHLVDGKWDTGWYKPDTSGAFKRPETKFRAKELEIEPGRYHLYASYACPWAHRILIMRSLLGLEEAIGVTIVASKMGDDGWIFEGEDGEADPLHGAKFLRDVYTRAESKYTGRVTVPVLWDETKGTIANNESRELMRLFDTQLAPMGTTGVRLVTAENMAAVDAMIDANYESFNNGVYRAGFATSQEAYEKACRDVFATLERCEGILATQRYLCGSELTEADIAFFTTCLRFDVVYYAHFKCNVKRLQDFPNVQGFLKDLYQRPEIKRTCRLDHIKTHYYWSQVTVNPTRIVPLGPELDLDSPHGRDRF